MAVEIQPTVKLFRKKTQNYNKKNQKTTTTTKKQQHQQIQTVNVKSLGADYAPTDGERLPLAAKDLGASDVYPQSLAHNPNGRFVTVCGDGE